MIAVRRNPERPASIQLSSLVKPDIILAVMANTQTLLRAHLTGSSAPVRLYQTAVPAGRVLKLDVSQEFDYAPCR
jgi:hypothetical protein